MIDPPPYWVKVFSTTGLLRGPRRMRKWKRKIEFADGPLMELSFMRPIKVLGEDRASIRKPEGHSGKANNFAKNIQLSNQPLYPLDLDLER